MSGPNAGAGQLNGVIPGVRQRAGDMVEQSSPELAMNVAREGATGAPDQQMLATLQSIGVTPGEAPPAEAAQEQPAPGNNADRLQLINGLLASAQNAVAPEGAANTPTSSALAQIAGAPATYLGGLLDFFKGPEEAPAKAQILSKFAKHPEGQRQIFAAQVGPGYDTRVSGDKVEFKRQGETEWRPIDPGYFSSLHGLITRLADFAPELLEGGVATAGLAVGAAEGAAAGAPAGGFGAIPGAVAGAALGSGAANAAGAMAREAVSRLLGSEPDPSLGTNIALAGGIGAVAGAAGQVLRKPLEGAVSWLTAQAEHSQAATAAKVSELHKGLADVYHLATGRALPEAGQYAPALLDQRAGELGSSALEGAYKRYGANVGAAWEQTAKALKDQRLPVTNFVQPLEKTLQEGYAFRPVPRIIPSDPVKYEAIAEQSVPFELKQLAELWNDLANKGGLDVKEMHSVHDMLLKGANYTNDAPTGVERTYRELHQAFAKERDNVLLNATKGTEAEGLVKNAMQQYAENIDALRQFHRKVEIAPEKYADMLLKDSKVAGAAKNVLVNPGGQEGFQAWDAIRSYHITNAMEGARDVKTGIVDLKKLYDTLAKKEGVSEVVLGKESMQQLQRLGVSMDKLTWQGLLANPDSIQSGGIVRALTKFAISKFNPAYGANLLGAMTSYDPKVLGLIQEKGIQVFAQEAKTLQERNYYMRAGKMVQRLLDVTKIDGALPGRSRSVIPLEQGAIPALLNAGVRPATEDPGTQQASARSGYQMYLERQQAKAADLQRQIAQASPTGIPTPAYQQTLFAAKGRSRLHLKH